MNLDIFKLIVVLLSLVYCNLKIKSHINSINYRIMNVGLSLLLFAAFLDFTDGFKSLDSVFIIGRCSPGHDILEDQFGDALGLALFVFAAFREIVRIKK